MSGSDESLRMNSSGAGGSWGLGGPTPTRSLSLVGDRTLTEVRAKAHAKGQEITHGDWPDRANSAIDRPLHGANHAAMCQFRQQFVNPVIEA